MKNHVFLVILLTLSNVVFSQNPPIIEFPPMIITVDDPPAKPPREDPRQGPGYPKRGVKPPSSSQPIPVKSTVVEDFSKLYIKKYVAAYKLLPKSTPASITTSNFKQVLGRVVGGAIKVYGFYSAIEDLKKGNPGTAVCFVIGFPSTPYGIVAGVLCDATLATYRVYNPKNQ